MVPLSQRFFLKIFRCRRFVEYELSPFFLRDSRASETRASVKTTPSEKGSPFSLGVIFMRAHASLALLSRGKNGDNS